jgi:mannose-6-phosphate isomerase-like protein (cupin superfamily)
VGDTRADGTTELDEYTLVLKGLLRVEHKDGSLDVQAGQAVLVRRGEWVRYSTPTEGGAEYVAVCLPAFSPETVYRDEMCSGLKDDRSFAFGGRSHSGPV